MTVKEGEVAMARLRGTSIKQSALADVMSHLSKLPKREKDPGTVVSLSEIFRAKEYMAEIKGALKKGYSFSDIAEIFTEKCGVNISARQIKYHYTCAKNRSAKGKSSKNTDKTSTSGACVPSADSQRTGAVGCAEGNRMASDSETIPSLKVTGFVSENRTTSGAEGNIDSDAFSFDTRPKES
jgi:hypothetical protein